MYVVLFFTPLHVTCMSVIVIRTTLLLIMMIMLWWDLELGHVVPVERVNLVGVVKTS